MTSEKKLNKQQLAAVKYGTGPLLIIAGAGTGKTTVITERVKHLISSGLAKPEEILSLTFTEKAAQEMETRIDQAMPYGYTQMWVMTFHSFCDRILRDEGLHIGLNSNFQLLTETEATSLLHRHLFDLGLEYFRPLGNPTKFISGLLTHFSRLQDEDISPRLYLDWAASLKNQTADSRMDQEKYLELAKVYQAYTDLKIKDSQLDFADLISYTLQLFRTRPNILRDYQSKFKYILVDEFQDTNYSQNQLVNLMVNSSQNLTVVADDDQCLPAGTLITTPAGTTTIEKMSVGDSVVTAVGKGYLSTSTVTHINKNLKSARMITLITESGRKIVATDNHKFFCLTPGKKYGIRRFYYVYLMHRRNLGWRLGITDDLAQRLKLERSADSILAIKSCSTESEARYYETLYTLKYGIPTCPFMPRKRMTLKGEWLTKLYSQIDTNTAAIKLARDLGVYLHAHHFALGGVVRGGSHRAKVILTLCYRRHRTKWARNRLLLNPSVSHQVHLETSSPTIINKLRQHNIHLTKAKKGWKVQKAFSDILQAGEFARKLVNTTDAIFESKFEVGKRNNFSRRALVIPVGNILPGMRIPVVLGAEVVYDQVISRRVTYKRISVYDLEIAKSHNYIANGIVVHNSIYRWRGAAVSNVIQFKSTYPKAKIIVLTQNYRSSQEILDRAYQLIQYNNPDRLEIKEKIDKKLTAVRRHPPEPIEFIHTSGVEDEADAVAKKIKEFLSATHLELSPKDIAILVRANVHSEPFLRALSRRGIPAQFLGPARLFHQPEVKDLIAYLRFLSDINDDISLYRVLAMDFFALSPRDLASLTSFTKRSGLSLFSALEHLSGIRTTQIVLPRPPLTADSIDTLKNLISLIHHHLGLLSKESAGQILYYFLRDSGMLSAILKYQTPIDEHRAANITRFFNKLKTFESEHSDASVRAVMDWLDLSLEVGESPLATNFDWSDNDAINILTLHSAKGLEFRVVFLVNLVSQRFPSSQRQETIPIPEALIKEILPSGDFHLQEERRLFYVGLTRAKDRVFLTAADYYGEGKRAKKLSPFITETLGSLAVSSATQVESQLSLIDWQKTSPPTPQTTNHKQITINYLSYSQIQTFLDCPLHYKAKYILKLPTPPSAASGFGNTIHRTLRDFFDQTARGLKPDILKLFAQNWSPAGYLNPRHAVAYQAKGRRYLQEYLATRFDPRHLPVKLEEPFTVPVVSDNRSRTIKIGGKIDRVDILPGGKIEIIDYKTSSKSLTQKEAEKDLQLSFYALAATSIPYPPFGKKSQDIILSLYYFEEDKKISVTRTAAQLDQAKKQIFEYADAISRSDFRCSGSIICQKCDFKTLCDMATSSG
ncbi:MAG: ATP-dependent DNA helicase PcrA [Candidatus Amesbacteria bacterium GW2011_GWB1_47_19]|nr:MAG: ATP-dependent DNA helicase PcrA [Candidatus Amesbacteria bacterium GW2011_GWA1_44_24]KKU32074.1 MAG: hypothetical protein UX46_C0001G0061 [Candidatus Amesbacteria bacterium GW2011_GWC1_46_24]KKU67758.1 MAG: ATP-dependent DNA helicase PcrA [Candidatus Amesbacteria bacterium GW2011_GWB1_47_19]OGD06057.1 MAG: hypothetical protein A2379_03115 [Candidatus Amesbacteria bacterium RIFOXYB1_FULL_47_13]